MGGLHLPNLWSSILVLEVSFVVVGVVPTLLLTRFPRLPGPGGIAGVAC